MTPPDKLEPFELLKLMHRQKLDMSHEQVGELLAEVERLRDALARLHTECGYSNPEHCFVCAAIRNRGNTEGREG